MALSKMFLGEVILVAGGYLNAAGGPFTDSVELFSPDGKCNYFLAGLPKMIMGSAIVLYNGRITVCGGGSNQVPSF